MKNAVVSIGAFALLGILPAAASRGAVVTFSGAYSNGQNPIPASYQPLQNTYTGVDSTTDGQDIDVTITWGGYSTSNADANGGVYDHTTGNVPGRKGVVGYDNGNADISMTFDSAVTIPSFYFSNFNATAPNATFTMRFRGYTNPGDPTAAVDISRTYTQTTGPNNGGYQWITETGLGNTPIRQFVVSGDSFKQLDDLTINAVPEPASIALVAPVSLLALKRRRND